MRSRDPRLRMRGSRLAPSDARTFSNDISAPLGSPVQLTLFVDLSIAPEPLYQAGRTAAMLPMIIVATSIEKVGGTVPDPPGRPRRAFNRAR